MNFTKRVSGLIDGVAALQVFQVLRYGGLLLTSILLSKSAITTGDIGVYETLLFFAGTITYFWVTGIINSMLMGYNEHKDKLFLNIFLLLTGFSILSFVVILVFKSWVIRRFGLPDIDLYHIFALYVLLNTPCFIIEYIYLLKKQPKSIILYGLITFVLTIALVALPVYKGLSVDFAIYGLLIVAIIKMLWALVLLVKSSSRNDMDFSLIKKYLYLAYPLIIAAFLGGASEYTDGIIVNTFFDKTSFAIYRYGAKELPLALLLANAMSNALVPLIAGSTQLEEKLAVIKSKSTKLMHLLFPLSIVLMLLSHWLFTHVFNPAFAAGAGIFNVYLLLLVSRIVFPQTILLGLKKTKVLLFTSVAELIINVLASIILALQFGIIGVAYGTLIACIFEKAVYIIYNKYVLGIKMREYVNNRLLLGYSFVLICLYILISE